MENDALADQILAALEQLLQAAGPEWTLQFLQAGMEEIMGTAQEQTPAMSPPMGGNNMRRM